MTTSAAGDKSTLALMEKACKAYAELDIDLDTIVTLFTDDVLFPIAGRHPLAGATSGRPPWGEERERDT